MASSGFKLVALDYSQIELRIAAFLSKDKKLVKIFKEGRDIHEAVASEIFEVKPEEVDKEMRRKAKVINFGILYGMGVNALRVNLGTERKEAQKFYNDFFEKHSGLAEYLEDTKAFAHKVGYTETFFGRKRYFESIKSSLPHIRAHAERMAINAPIQGTQADITKIAMRKVDEYITKNKLDKDVYLLLQVHDELIFEIKTAKSEEIALELKRIMESVLTPKETGGVPIICDAQIGPHWGALKKL